MLVEKRIGTCPLCHGSVFKRITNDSECTWCCDCGGAGKNAVHHNKIYIPEESNPDPKIIRLGARE